MTRTCAEELTEQSLDVQRRLLLHVLDGRDTLRDQWVRCGGDVMSRQSMVSWRQRPKEVSNLQ